MNVVLWVLQGLLAVAFAGAGIIKTTRPKDQLKAAMPWTEDFSATQIKGIGALEFLAALGLILPAVTGIAPVLTPLAATGLVLVMAGAILTHLRRKESSVIVVNVVLLALAAVVAWGRFGPYAF
ncbi:DoxX family protein [Acrocarpospora catenulata]|uniref:DoxX family protein n=1 Tax=Acrocarpospora catenulata TaxID=2836182 RepID=UPI001BDB3D9C|nr:DoxX family protein [Acrocarpospora catenulata]